MKKFFVGLLLALVVLACFGCGGGVEPERFETKTVTLFDLTSIYQLHKNGDSGAWFSDFASEQYTLSESAVYANGNPVFDNTIIKSGDSLVCKLTLTAKQKTRTGVNYTFDGVAKDAFKHSSATVTNPVGSGTTMQVTITYTVK